MPSPIDTLNFTANYPFAEERWWGGEKRVLPEISIFITDSQWSLFREPSRTSESFFSFEETIQSAGCTRAAHPSFLLSSAEASLNFCSPSERGLNFPNGRAVRFCFQIVSIIFILRIILFHNWDLEYSKKQETDEEEKLWKIKRDWKLVTILSGDQLYNRILWSFMKVLRRRGLCFSLPAFWLILVVHPPPATTPKRKKKDFSII